MQEQLSILCKFEMAFFFENGKIDDALTNRDADARCTVARFENSEGKILDWKGRLARDVDKRLERHLAVAALYERHINSPTDIDRDYRKFKARKSSRGSSKLQLPNEVTNFRRFFSGLMSIFHSRQAKNSSSKENDSAFSSSSMAAV